MHRIAIALPHHKFSCAHMTVFPDGTKERLHGHNFPEAIALDVERVDLPAMIPFHSIKSAIAQLCDEWKEHVLIAGANPRLEVLRDSDEYEIRLCGQRYVFPRGDVLVLPVDNISVEQLAHHVCETLRTRLSSILTPNVKRFEVTVEENPGQGSSCAHVY